MQEEKNMPDKTKDLSKAAALLGRSGGRKTSAAKKRAARINGKLGGRPRKEAK